MRDNFGLPAELDALLLFLFLSMAPSYKGDLHLATSPSMWCVCEWERRASSHESEVALLVSRRQCLHRSYLCALLTSLVLLPSMRLEDDIRVNLARDKEGGGHVGPAATRLL